MKNQGKMVLIGCVLGAVLGVLIWTYLYLVHEMTNLLWVYIPSKIGFAYYPIALCLLGGVLIGLMQKKFGRYPKELEDVMTDYKLNRAVRYDNLYIVALAAFLPLVFGGSIGPEAGLTGIIMGLCCWIGDHIKSMAKEDRSFREIGLSATLALIFINPLFGLISPMEFDGDVEIPRAPKILINLASVSSAMLAYLSLRNWLGGGLGIVKFSGLQVGTSEWLALLPIALFGCAVGYVYFGVSKLIKVLLKPLAARPVTLAIVGGCLLGITGLLFPQVLFSGEAQLRDLQEQWQGMALWLLPFSGFAKFVITEICFESGWRGGKIFPLIFSGVCLGYAVPLVFPVNQIFSLCVVTAVLLAMVIRKPLAVSVLLLLCFPFEALIFIVPAACLGSILPIPKAIRRHKTAT